MPTPDINKISISPSRETLFKFIKECIQLSTDVCLQDIFLSNINIPSRGGLYASVHLLHRNKLGSDNSGYSIFRDDPRYITMHTYLTYRDRYSIQFYKSTGKEDGRASALDQATLFHAFISNTTDRNNTTLLQKGTEKKVIQSMTAQGYSITGIGNVRNISISTQNTQRYEPRGEVEFFLSYLLTVSHVLYNVSLLPSPLSFVRKKPTQREAITDKEGRILYYTGREGQYSGTGKLDLEELANSTDTTRLTIVNGEEELELISPAHIPEFRSISNPNLIAQKLQDFIRRTTVNNYTNRIAKAFKQCQVQYIDNRQARVKHYLSDEEYTKYTALFDHQGFVITDIAINEMNLVRLKFKGDVADNLGLLTGDLIVD